MNDNNIKGAKSKNYMADLFFGTAEKTFEESAFVEKSQFKPYNSDDLYQKVGDYSIYEEMLNDDQVSVALQLKKDLVLGAGFDIVAQDDDQDEIVEDINRALTQDVSPSFEELLEEILSAYEFGFSISEKIFKTRDDGSLTLSTLRTRHPNTWLINTDNKGNVDAITQQGVSAGFSDILVKPQSVIHYVNNRKFQNPFGRSDLRPAYQAYFTKKHITRYYAIFLEKAASPTPIARYDKTVKDATVTKIFNIIKSFQSRTAMTIPKDIEIEFLEAKSDGEAFIKGINIFNMFIGRSLTIPDLIGFQGSDTGGGSQALSREQMKIFTTHIKRRRSILEGIVNKHIVQPLVIFNHGDIDNPPIFQLRPISDEDAADYAKIFLEAVKAGAYKPNEEEINHFRSLIKFPEGEVEVPVPPAPIVMPPPGDGSGTAAPGEDIAPDTDTPAEPAPAEGDKEIEGDDKENNKQSFAQDKGDGGFKDLEEGFKDKVDFKAIESLLDGTTTRIIQETKMLVDDMVASAIDQIEKKKILQKKDIKLIDGIKLKGLKGLQLSLKKNLRTLFQDGQRLGVNELFGKNNFDQPLLPEEFLTVLENETFAAVGDWEYKFKQDLRVQLQAAIKDGMPLSTVIQEIEGVAEEKMNVSIERYARTKSTEVINNARLAVFNSSDIVEGYQYSAILDGRTSDICAGLHGKKFKRGTEPVPPMHFNCRSMLVPITKFEKFEPDTSAGGTVQTKRAGEIKLGKPIPIEQFISENIGQGFSKK